MDFKAGRIPFSLSRYTDSTCGVEGNIVIILEAFIAILQTCQSALVGSDIALFA
jgi:hypothetical protein